MVCAFTVSVLNLAYPKIAGKIIEVKQLDYVLTFSAVLLGIFLLKAALNYLIVYWGHVVACVFRATCARNFSRICKNCRSLITTKPKSAR